MTSFSLALEISLSLSLILCVSLVPPCVAVRRHSLRQCAITSALHRVTAEVQMS